MCHTVEFLEVNPEQLQVQVSPSAHGLGWVGLYTEYSIQCLPHPPNSARALGNGTDAAGYHINMVEKQNLCQPNPGLRPDGTPCRLFKAI